MISRPLDTLQALAFNLLCCYPEEHGIFLAIGDLVIQVRTNSAAVAGELRRYFNEFIGMDEHDHIVIHALETEEMDFPVAYHLKEPDPGKTKIKEEYVDFPDGRIVRKRLTGLCFLFNGSVNIAVGPCLANVNQIVNFINNRFIEWMVRRGGLLGHASAVCVESKGMAFAGFSGSGKSTLSLHVLVRGASFVSNDRLIVSDARGLLRMYGIPKHPRVNPGTLLSIRKLRHIMNGEEQAYYSHLPLDELWSAERKYDVVIDEAFGAHRFRLSAAMKGVLLLNWRRDGSPFSIRKIDIAQRPDLLPAFMKAPGLFFLPEAGREPPDLRPEQYSSVLARCPVFEAGGTVDFDKAADFCMDFLNGRVGW